MTASTSRWQQIQQYIWLIIGLLCLLAALIFWAITDKKELVYVENPVEEQQVTIQPEKVAATVNLGSLTTAVRPLETTTRIVATGTHGPEFRGTKFFQDHANRWTIVIFQASKEEVIQNFLRQQPSRKDFIYFRLNAKNQPDRYVLAYGVYKSSAEAQQQRLKMNLPASVQPYSKALADYKDLINDLGSEELQSTQQLRAVQLKPTALPVIDESVLAALKPVTKAVENSLTTTTITRRDAEGNVVDVQKSQNSAPKAVERSREASTPETSRANTP
ncbi:hypothetical protein [Acinetobacter larvae]|uniref:SPOR domain-containing protein n=1 Tax=Acinetobacter larvae TaxID=1789224 RepID=A0A1B2M2M1_9GAMM|nr:hypothetical protein [Acinetobacter larvae]AOA59437.1 hypothetical protein BFG52_14495 [Acinetobacter larvae]